jgi:hypothetical protein
LAERAVGDFGNSDLSERACIANDQSDLAGGLNDARQESIEALLRGLSEYDPLESKSDYSEQVCRIEEKPPGERSSPWIDLDMIKEKLAEAAKFAGDFVGGVGDFAKNYVELRQANTKGADKYFHCMANCESAQRGPGGALAADLISSTREGIDYYTNQLKGLSEAESTADCLADMRANEAGRQAGIDGTRCYPACRPYEPRWEQK